MRDKVAPLLISLYRCRSWRERSACTHTNIHHTQRGESDDADEQRDQRNRDSGRDDKVDGVGQAIPEAVQYRDKEVGHEDQTSNTKTVVWSALAEQDSGENGRPGSMPKGSEQAAQDRG